MHSDGDLFRFQLLQTLQNAMLTTEPYDDFWHAKKERLRPEFQQFSLEPEHVPVFLNLRGGLKLDPVDRVVFSVRLAVPDYWGKVSETLGSSMKNNVTGCHVLASTSPPIIIFTLPKPVFTTEQY